jgi:enoyl-CoA hydratase
VRQKEETLGETQNGDAGQILLSETRGHIRILTINRPERMNAISPELGDALIEAFVEANSDDTVRAVATVPSAPVPT